MTQTPPGETRQMEWDSPWGRGAPGWHLECSVMSGQLLGFPFDIHTGGIDHREIHHPNEIAQNQAYLGGEHGGVNYWLHNEFLLLHDDKMSKSKGDFLRLQTLLDWGIHPLVYRYFNLMTHYRSQLEFSMESLVSSKTGLERLLRRVQTLRPKAPAAQLDVLGTILELDVEPIACGAADARADGQAAGSGRRRWWLDLGARIRRARIAAAAVSAGRPRGGRGDAGGDHQRLCGLSEPGRSHAALRGADRHRSRRQRPRTESPRAEGRHQGRHRVRARGHAESKNAGSSHSRRRALTHGSAKSSQTRKAPPVGLEANLAVLGRGCTCIEVVL